MRIHSFRLRIAALVLESVLAIACRGGRGGADQPAAPAFGQLSASLSAASRALCHGRERCQIVETHPCGLGDCALATLRVSHQVDASDDEGRCDRREYWLLATSIPHRLLAVDCEEQWGADHAGPARLAVSNGEIRISYTEYQSSDGCEVVEATIRPTPLTLTRYERWNGTVVSSICRDRRPATRLPQAGDGSPGLPLVVLHRD